MHFCYSHHEMTQTQQEKKDQHQRAGINCIMMTVHKHKT